MKPLVRFWMTHDKDNQWTSLRGQCGDSGDDEVLLYDITHMDDGWYCHLWITLKTDPDAHAFQLIAASPDLFPCLVAAEAHAQEECARREAQDWNEADRS